jgi:hypothetical protein
LVLINHYDRIVESIAELSEKEKLLIFGSICILLTHINDTNRMASHRPIRLAHSIAINLINKCITELGSFSVRDQAYALLPYLLCPPSPLPLTSFIIRSFSFS